MNKLISLRNMLLCSMFLLYTQAIIAQETTDQVASKSLVIGFMSNDSVMHSMPQYIEAQHNLQNLKLQYEAEARRSERDFQSRFEEFLQDQKNMPQTILQKRQNELQSLLDTNIAFRLKVQDLLSHAQADLMFDVRTTLVSAISKVAKEHGINLVVNTDDPGISYFDPDTAIDITSFVRKELGLE